MHSVMASRAWRDSIRNDTVKWAAWQKSREGQKKRRNARILADPKRHEANLKLQRGHHKRRRLRDPIRVAKLHTAQLKRWKKRYLDKFRIACRRRYNPNRRRAYQERRTQRDPEWQVRRGRLAHARKYYGDAAYAEIIQLFKQIHLEVKNEET